MIKFLYCKLNLNQMYIGIFVSSDWFDVLQIETNWVVIEEIKL